MEDDSDTKQGSFQPFTQTPCIYHGGVGWMEFRIMYAAKHAPL
jgi:hypothetical protein